MTSTLKSPATGEPYRFVTQHPELLAFDWTLAPGASLPAHHHPGQTERLALTAGRLEIEVAGTRRVAGVRDVVEVPADAPDPVRAVGKEPADARVELRPALDSARFFETFAGLSATGRAGRGGAPRDLLALAVWARGFRHEVRLAGPTGTVGPAALAPLAWRGRRPGCTAHTPVPGA